MARDQNIGGMKVRVAPGELTLIRPPHPATSVLLWLFGAAAAGLLVWFLGGGLQIDCARARKTCLVRTPRGDHLTFRVDDVQAVSVSHLPLGSGNRTLVVTTREGNVPLGGTPLITASQVEEGADLLHAYFGDGEDESLFVTFRNWALALEVSLPFALVAVLIAIFRRRRFKVTLHLHEEDLAVRRQTLLSTAHAPVLPRSAQVDLSSEGAPQVGAQRLVLRLPDGRSFPVSPWTTPQGLPELTALRQEIGAFLQRAQPGG